MELNVEECLNITDLSIMKIAECCPNIKDLNVSNCPNITLASKNKFREDCTGRLEG
jgi:hypothetical protein